MKMLNYTVLLGLMNPDYSLCLSSCVGDESLMI